MLVVMLREGSKRKINRESFTTRHGTEGLASRIATVEARVGLGRGGAAVAADSRALAAAPTPGACSSVAAEWTAESFI